MDEIGFKTEILREYKVLVLRDIKKYYTSNYTAREIVIYIEYIGIIEDNISIVFITKGKYILNR
jgi:hypothetical protein